MGLVYKISDKELLDIRNKIFIESGIQSLEKNSFTKSPFSTALFGRNNLGDYTYELCRVSKGSQLEILVTHISKGDNWIKIYLNIFKLFPEIQSIEQLNGVDGLQYHLLPNSLTKMRLRVDDIKGIPLFNYHFMFGGHKLKSFKTERGLKKGMKELSSLIKEDLTNIDSFVKRWYEIHQVNVTDWKGNKRK
ncbi:MAG: hypothetical protein ABIN01_14035 [Ferruginibacter sp.]